MEQKIPMERKLELAQYIRRENMENRMKVRQRENFLYGTAYDIPVLDGERRESMGYAAVGQTRMDEGQGAEEKTMLSGFKCRMILALLAFALFLLCDAGGGKVGSYSVKEIHEKIAEDPFGLCGKEGAAVLDELASLLDFER